MRILFCNPRNAQGANHSRKGMYVPLGILSMCTVLKDRLGDAIELEVQDEDIIDADLNSFHKFDLVCFYSTTFNYKTCIQYAKVAKEGGAVTVVGGPHITVLAHNVIRNQTCFDFAIKGEGEEPIFRLVQELMKGEGANFKSIPNTVTKIDGEVFINPGHWESDLTKMPIPKREFVPFNMYLENFQKLYPEKSTMRPGSIYSSKGCAWRDRTGGCAFCARLEEGVKFRTNDQIWQEVRYLKEDHGVNSIWDIADDNINNVKWFQKFVEDKPKDLQDMTFFIYSRVSGIRPDVLPYLKRLNVIECFLGIESGDDGILKNAMKGQTFNSALRALSTLQKMDIKYFPSFVLGLEGESESSLQNTYRLCQEITNLGGVDRLGVSIMMPIPGAPVYTSLLTNSGIKDELRKADDIDIKYLEQYWIENFTKTNYTTVLEYRRKIQDLLTDKQLKVFGGRSDEEEKATLRGLNQAKEMVC